MANLTIEDMKVMSEVDVRTVDRNTLTDLADIEINTSKPVAQKLGMFASQSSNIYIHKVDDYVVKVIHSKDAPGIDEKMSEHLRRMVEIYF